MGFRMAAVAALLVLGAGAIPKAAADEEEVNTYRTPTKERVVCRREPVTGSHMKRKVCRTESQMQQDQVDARNQLRQMQDLRDQELRMEAIKRSQ